MADIQKYLDAIMKAIKGKEVRSSIHDSIKAINDETERIIVDVDERHRIFEAEITKQQEDYETEITNRQDAYETNLTNKENAFEEDLNKRFVDNIDESVSEWLALHPEATTTVQDGSIAEIKIQPDFLKKIKKDYITPQMFGAKGDGITDDSNAFQMAVDYAYSQSNGGGKIFVPHGVYIIEHPIELYRNIGLDNSLNAVESQAYVTIGGCAPTIVIEGESYNNTIIKGKNTDCVFKCQKDPANYDQELLFSHIQFDGNNNTGTSFDLTREHFCGKAITFNYCGFTNFNNYGFVFIRKGEGTGTRTGDRTTFTFEHCRFGGNDVGIGVSGDDFNMRYCYVQRNTHYGIHILADCHRVNFDNCKIQYNGFNTEGADGAQVLISEDSELITCQDINFSNTYFENKKPSDNVDAIFAIGSNCNIYNLNFNSCYINSFNAPYFIHKFGDATVKGIYITGCTIRNIVSDDPYLIYVSESTHFIYDISEISNQYDGIKKIDGTNAILKLINIYGSGNHIRASKGLWNINNSARDFGNSSPIIMAGAIASNGTIYNQMGDFIVEKTGTGVYQITFTNPSESTVGNTARYPLFVRGHGNTPQISAYVSNITSTGFEVTTFAWDTTYSSMTIRDYPFYFILAYLAKI